MATDYSHLDALLARLGRENDRLAAAKNENEKAFREREIASVSREIEGEYKFLGIKPMTTEEILAELDL